MWSWNGSELLQASQPGEDKESTKKEALGKPMGLLGWCLFCLWRRLYTQLLVVIKWVLDELFNWFNQCTHVDRRRNSKRRKGKLKWHLCESQWLLILLKGYSTVFFLLGRRDNVPWEPVVKLSTIVARTSSSSYRQLPWPSWRRIG